MRISKNAIFMHPEKHSGLTGFERLYISQNLSIQIRDFITLDKSRKSLNNLFKMAMDLGFPTMNLVLASYDGMTMIAEIKKEFISFALWRHYNNPEPLLFSSHKDNGGRIATINIKGMDDLNIAYGAQVFLYFLLFIDVERKVLKPKQKHAPKKYEPIKNDTPVSFTVADANWSFEVDVNAPFSVSGHYRLQRYGPGRSRAKLIYIQPFEKSGYHRKAGKDNFFKNK